jgi:ring-1,2-phenylacetyl-CoA epoxidase subunit PaaE
MQDTTVNLCVKKIIRETSDTRTYTFEPTGNPTIRYRPGQFLTFLLPGLSTPTDHEIRRSYSLSSAPGVDALPAVTVKRVANGEISRYWHNHIREGSRLKALPPAGRFTPDPAGDTPRDIVLIGAGSGITPLFSILKYVLSFEQESHVTLLYASRRERDIIFSEELEQWQQRYPQRLEVIHVLSQPTDEWTGLRGRINNFRLESIIGQKIHFRKSDARFFLCGPFELMRIAEITLLFMGFAAGQIRKENFVIDTVPPPPKRSEPHTIRFRYRGQEHTLPVPAFTTILQAGLNAGIPIPYSCKGGRCATCAALCRTGSVRMSLNDVLTERDLAQGWVLTCTAYPEDDEVMIELV